MTLKIPSQHSSDKAQTHNICIGNMAGLKEMPMGGSNAIWLRSGQTQPRIPAKRQGFYINQDIKLPHIQAIHQLQNVYYELTGDVPKRQPPSTRYEPPAPDKIVHEPWERRSGPGKYRTPKG